MKNLKATVAMFVLCGVAVGCGVSTDETKPTALTEDQSQLIDAVRAEYPDAIISVEEGDAHPDLESKGCAGTCCIIITLDPTNGKGGFTSTSGC